MENIKVMEKKIKDYLHLYLGQKIRIFNKVTNDFSGWRKMSCSDLSVALNPDVKIEIQLRRVSSITIDEVKNYMLITERYVPNGDGSYNKEQIEDIEYQLKEGGFRMRMTGDTFCYLTKQGFDLFRLIESGLAIDATTFKNDTVTK
jgi:hypothetical protein